MTDCATTVPAGTYWLGDPCYSIDPHDWDDLLDAFDDFTRPAADWRGGLVVAFLTAHGDGLYPLTRDGRLVARLPVDAGLIGLVPAHLDLAPGQGLAHRVTFDDPVRASRRGGDLRFGPYLVATAGR